MIEVPDTTVSIPPTTTKEQDLTTAGQRDVNMLWEGTQSMIAKYVILGTIVIDGAAVIISMLVGRDLTAAQGLSLGFVNSLAAGVVSFYFSRTNHAAIGGIGQKPQQEYIGR
jgi:hypothetical protein